jgi:hypothetical protein
VWLHTHSEAKKEEKVIKLDDYVCWRQHQLNEELKRKEGTLMSRNHSLVEIRLMKNL